MNVLSLFDGMSCGQIALDQLGIKVDNYFASEIDKHAIKVTQHNFPKTVQLGDGTKINYKDGVLYTENGNFKVGKIDLVTGGFPCFPTGTKIVTSKGLENIENIKVDDEVLTHKGRYRKVVAPMCKSYNGTIYNIKPYYYSFNIPTTNEHPFLTQRGWVNAEKLTISDYLMMPLNKENVNPEQIKYTQKINQFVEEDSETKLPLLNEDFWKLIGYWVADGWTNDRRGGKENRKRYVTYLASTDKKNKFIIPVLNNLGIKYYVDDSSKTCSKIRIGNKEVWMYVKQFTTGSRAHEKVIPEFVQNMPINLIKSFLLGYKTGDGTEYVDKNQKHIVSYSSVSLNLLEGIRRLILKIDLELYSLCQSHKEGECYIEGRKVKNRDCYILRQVLNSKKRHVYFDNDYVYYKIRNITTNIVTNLPVFNFEVEEDNSYCLPLTAVHNCQSLSLANRGGGNVDEGKSALFFEMLRLLREVQPTYFLAENVKMNENSKNIISEALGVKPIKINSSLVLIQNRDRLYWTNLVEDLKIEDRGLYLRDHYCADFNEKLILKGKGLNKLQRPRNRAIDIFSDKVPTLMKSQEKLPTDAVIFKQGDIYRYPTVREAEMMQTVPLDYTDVEGVTYNNKMGMLGNGWTVDVIVEFLKPLLNRSVTE